MTAKEPTVAVVIPAHDEEDSLPFALRSLRDQTRPPDEVVVVDDGSTDGTPGVCEEFGVRCIRQRQAGPAAARNRGVREVRSDFVSLLDADDWYSPDKLEKSLESILELGALALGTDAWVVAGDQVLGAKNGDRRIPYAITLERLLKDNPLVCSTMVFRREAFLRAGGFDEDPRLISTEDYDLWIRFSRVEPIAYLPRALTFYRTSEGSLGTNERFLIGVDRICEKLAETHGSEPHFRRLMDRRRARSRLDLAWDRLAEGRKAEARALMREARALGRPWEAIRMWVRSLF
ncbi:MAG: hypothetical protein Fur0037_16230 [Planctomycetota bacterium]